jgi:hypothetical protein
VFQCWSLGFDKCAIVTQNVNFRRNWMGRIWELCNFSVNLKQNRERREKERIN